MAGSYKRKNIGKCPQNEGHGSSDWKDLAVGLGLGSHCGMDHMQRSTGSTALTFSIAT